MALKNISVLAGTDAGAQSRLDYAAALALKHDAHVTGLGLLGNLTVPGYMVAYMTEAVAKLTELSFEERMEALRARFEETMRRNGLIDRSEWRALRGDPTETAIRMTRYADLVVVGQEDPAAEEPVPIDVEALLLACGRPLLFVPYAFRQAGIGRHVMIAWNATREAARAVADALPILVAADRVTIFAVNQIASLGDAPGATIAWHLAHHGVKAEALHTEVRDLDVADAILSRMADLDVDTLVMGAYGHSRLREAVLGGVTRDILRHMTVPVLMSH